MTDLEMTRLCAEAMGWTFIPAGESPGCGFGSWRAEHYEVDGKVVQWDYHWNPLTDDEQAMALVKRFRMEIMRGSEKLYLCMINESGVNGGYDDDLNRAIVECVAKMRQGMTGERA